MADVAGGSVGVGEVDDGHEVVVVLEQTCVAAGSHRADLGDTAQDHHRSPERVLLGDRHTLGPTMGDHLSEHNASAMSGSTTGEGWLARTPRSLRTHWATPTAASTATAVMNQAGRS